MKSSPVIWPVSNAGNIIIPGSPALHWSWTNSLLSIVVAFPTPVGGQGTIAVWLAGTDTPPFLQVIVAEFSLGLEIVKLPSPYGAIKYFDT